MRAAPKKLALVGLRCCGKSTVGRMLAERMRLRFVDLDVLLAERWSRELGLQPTAAGDLLAAHGIETFREREAAILQEYGIAPTDGLVMATGGGCVENPSNRKLLIEHTTCIWLRADPELLAARQAEDSTPRPALTDEEDPALEMRSLAVRREPLFSAVADIVVECGELDPEQLTAEVARRLESAEGS